MPKGEKYSLLYNPIDRHAWDASDDVVATECAVAADSGLSAKKKKKFLAFVQNTLVVTLDLLRLPIMMRVRKFLSGTIWVKYGLT